jgi:hypothetical protein
LRATCTATKRNGEPCTLPSNTHSGLCWAHDPANREKRRRGQSRGGEAKPTRELARLGARFEELADKVLSGEIERAVGAVAGQLLNGARACVRDGLAAREQEQLIERLEALEEGLEASRIARGYGA